MAENIFIKKPEDYQRTLQPIEQYVEDASLYLSKMTGDPVEQTRAWVIRTMAVKDPKALVLVRDPKGDRKKEVTTLGTFLSETLAERNQLAPSLTSYLDPEVKPSVLAKMLEHSLSLRSMEKEQAANAREQGDSDTAAFKDTMQKMRKLLANGLSGSHLSQGNITYNPSAHVALTATGRCATSYATANNERFLSGRRHYWRHDIAQNNIISILNHTDYPALQAVMERYQLVYPGVEDLLAMLKRSTRNYWYVKEYWQLLVRLVQALTPLERAAVLYTGDLHSLSRLNEDVVKTFLLSLSQVVDGTMEDAEAEALYRDLDNEEKNCITLLCTELLAGESLSKLKKGAHPNFPKIMATAQNFRATLAQYAPLIQTLWRTDNLPCSIAMFPSALRSHTLHSDTDSTIFTVAPWVEWVFGRMRMDDKGVALAAVMVYLSEQTLSHVLACLSATMGVKSSQLFRLTMKNEYIMESMVMTGRGKHYLGRLLTREGRKLTVPGLEIKGSAFKNAKQPAPIRMAFKDMVNRLFDDLREHGRISLVEYLHQCADLERKILASIRSGSSEHLVYQRIEEEKYYAKPMQSVYFHSLLWQAVFAPKYGQLGRGAYTAVKIPTTARNITTLKIWMVGIDDQALRKRFEDFLSKHKRVELKVLYLPLEKIKSHGIPEEVMVGSDFRRSLYTVMEPFYLLMESLGYYCRNERLTRLISDEF